MATDPTRISDIIVPEVFLPYVIQKTATLSALVQSGIVVADPRLDALAAAGGKIIQMPFFNDLTGDDEILSETTALDPDKIGAVQDEARLHMRGKAWGVGDLAAALSGADPMAAIGNLVAAFWARKEQALLIATLKGVFLDNAGNDSSDLISDLTGGSGAITDANRISATAILDAAAKLGDAAGKLTALCLHSVPFTRLQKLNLIDFIPDSEGKVQIPYYLGKRVIVDDGCPTEADGGNTEYTSYLFGEGAIGRGEGRAKYPVETDRDKLLGEDYLIHRRHFILHPRGIKWVEGSIGGVSPTNVEVALAAHWDRVYEKKNIRIVKLVTNG